ncbi:hypothetical protein [Haloarchaeobius sp. DT45]|uniref:hypothetical protein n=1 Tax=Haloarchaeobius sp. DT45 TaxID=3446116 RepID=UPI003F6AE1C9
MTSLSHPAKIVALGLQMTLFGTFLATFSGEAGSVGLLSFPLAAFGTLVVGYGLLL